MNVSRDLQSGSVKAELYGIDISFTILGVLAVCLRFWARHRSAGSYGLDDWLVLVSMFILFMNFALNAVMIENGLGLQAAIVPLPSLINIGKAIYGDEIVYVVALAIIKIAILVMYCRVFPLRSFRIASWILGTLTAVWSIMFIFICIFQCNPLPRAWNLTIPGSCLNLRAVFIGNAVPNIVTDAMILCMPIYHVWKLQMRNSQRLALTGIFLLGAFVIFASIYRFTTILKLNPLNLSYTLKTPTTWSHVEVSVALISACLPTMRPLLTSFLRAIGVHEATTGGNSHARDHSKSGPPKPSAMRKKTNTTDLSDFSVLEAGRDGWSTEDEVPLHNIQIQKDYTREDVTLADPQLVKMEDHTRQMWYPGSKAAS